MNPLEIYKLLPRLDCGECPSRTCMPFALLVAGSPEALGQCTRLDPGARSAIEAILCRGDWRDGLIRVLTEEVLRLDFREVAGGLGARLEEGGIVIRCLGRDYTLRRDGAILPDTGNKWIKILLLHYIRSRGCGEITGKWVSFADFKGGLVKASSFERDCVEPLRQLMDNDLHGADAALKRLGALSESGYPADYVWRLDLLPKVRSLILYSAGDDEFPSSAHILFDSVTNRFLDVESITFLGEGLIHAITRMLRAPA